MTQSYEQRTLHVAVKPDGSVSVQVLPGPPPEEDEGLELDIVAEASGTSSSLKVENHMMRAMRARGYTFLRRGRSPWFEVNLELLQSEIRELDDVMWLKGTTPVSFGGDFSDTKIHLHTILYPRHLALLPLEERALPREFTLQENAGTRTDVLSKPAIAHVFISHAEADGHIAERIGTHLEQRGWRTWYYERDSLPGPLHLEQTGRQIDGCDVMVVVLSRSAIASEFVTNEVFRAGETKKRIIPVLVELEHENLLKSNAKWAMVLGFSVSIAWDEKNAEGVLERIAGGVSYLAGRPRGLP